MEQHAVPQDITGFKFKLVGDMTVKQFGELAFGAVMAYIFFASNWNPFLRWPLVIFFTLLGFALAFVPIEERPLDSWIINFFRAIYRPTYYVWKKDTSFGTVATTLATIRSKTPEISPLSMPAQVASPQPQLWPTGDLGTTAKPAPSGPSAEKTPIKPGATEAKKEIKEEKPGEEAKAPQEAEMAPALPKNLSSQPLPSIPPLSVEELSKIREERLAELAGAKKVEAKVIKKEEGQKPDEVLTIDRLVKLRSDLSAQKEETEASKLASSEAEIQELIERNQKLMMQIDEIKNKLVLATEGTDNTASEKTLSELTEQKNKLSAQITTLREQIAGLRVAPLTSPEYQQPAPRKPSVRVVEKAAQRQQSIILTEQPNVINGLVLDENGMPIDGVILIIKDKLGNSIRAFKTNKVGQFIISTPLSSGTYYLELEKQSYTFDTLEITLTGQIMEPLEIRPKKIS